MKVSLLVLPFFLSLVSASARSWLPYWDLARHSAPSSLSDRLLLKAVKAGDAEQVERILATCNLAFDARDRDGMTVLAWTAKQGTVGMFRVLLDAVLLLDGASGAAAAATRSGRTALHFAIDRSSAEVAKVLLERGARLGLDVNAADMYGNTALHQASWSKNPEKVKALLEYGLPLGLDINAADKDGKTALYRSFKKLVFESSTALIEAGAEFDQKSTRAARQHRIVKYLLDCDNIDVFAELERVHTLPMGSFTLCIFIAITQRKLRSLTYFLGRIRSELERPEIRYPQLHELRDRAYELARRKREGSEAFAEVFGLFHDYFPGYFEVGLK